MLKVSIITVCFNSLSSLEKSIQSIIYQDYKNIEYIIVDGSSTDGSIDLINKYRDYISKFISEPDNGLYYAMNKGLDLATGDVITFLNSDDFYINNNIISDIANIFLKENINFLYADLLILSKHSNLRFSRYYSGFKSLNNLAKYGLMPPHPTFFISREVYNSIGFFNTKFTIAADFDLFVRISQYSDLRYFYLNFPIIIMANNGISNKGFASKLIIQKEIASSCVENNVNTYFFSFLIKIFYKLLQFNRCKIQRFL